MKKLVYFPLLLVALNSTAQQKDVYLFSGMDGLFELPDGSLTNFWSYGHNSQPMTFPAPLLEFDHGDTVNLHMRNLSPEAHTIHLHGLDVDQMNDGVPQTSFYVFQGDSATYSFVADQPGTFLYHCHVTTTLHLTMGMYGMLTVKYPGEMLFQNGPHYEKEYHYLASDLEVRVNDAPLQAFPFHKIKPDHFMINGLADEQIEEDTTMLLEVTAGQPIALRLGSMAYSKVKFIFPTGANAEVFMGDGRPLPSSFLTDELILYPGERFSVILTPDENMYGDIEVQYSNMLNKEYLGSNFIPVKDLGSPPDASEFVFPNPASEEVVINIGSEQEEISWYGVDGRLVARYRLTQGEHRVDLSGFAAGSYVVSSDNGSQQTLIIN